MSDKNDKFIGDARRILNESLGNLDGATAAKLNQARQRALAARSRRKSRLIIWGSLPAAGVALLLFLLLRPVAPIPQVVDPDFNDLNILTAKESLDFYQEDTEFYEWLSEVLENEKDLSGHDLSQPADAYAGRFAGPAEPRPGSSGSRIDRVSRHI